MSGDLWQDLRYGVRTMMKAPGFTAVAVIALALGIGANSAIFSVVNAVLLRPLPYKDPERASFYDALLRRVEALPGVRSAAVTTNLPLYRQGNSVGVTIEGQPVPTAGQMPAVVTRVISPDYFQTMRIPLLKGRALTAQDRAGATNAVVISETTARHFWPGEDPIGKRLCPGRPESPEDWWTVVGMVKDVRQFELGLEPKPQMYLSYYQVGFFEPRDLVVSTAVDPLSLASTVRTTVWGIDRDQPVSDIRTMEEILSASVARQRFSMLLLGIFAGLALVLAAVGIYGVMSYTVAQRTREFGIRMALGARRGDVLRLAAGQALRLVLIGVAGGLVAAFTLTRVMESLLFGVSATDPVTFALLSAVLVGVAMLASYLPARRATRVDPMTALRAE